MAMHPPAAISFAPRPGLMDSSSGAWLRVANNILPPRSLLYLGMWRSPDSMQLMPRSSQCLKLSIRCSGVFQALISTSIICDRCDSPPTMFDPIIRRETSYLPNLTIGIGSLERGPGTCGASRRGPLPGAPPPAPCGGCCGAALAATLEAAASAPSFSKKFRREFSPVGFGLDSDFIPVCLLCRHDMVRPMRIAHRARQFFV